MQNEATGHRNDVLLCLALAIAGVVLAFGTRAVWQTSDALLYALSVRESAPAFHPHHLLFVPILQLVHQAQILLGIPGGPIVAGQIHNVFWAIFLTIAVYGTVVRLSGSRPAGFAWALVMLFSQGVAAFATQVESYVPATACTMWLVWWLVCRGEGPITAGWIAGGAVPLALGILYHQAGILLCFAVAACFLAGCGSNRFRRLIWILSSAGALVFLSYVAAFVFRAGLPEDPGTGVAGFFEFCLRYPLGRHSDWGSVGNVTGGGLAALLDGLVWSIVYVPANWRPMLRWGLALILSALILWNIRALRSGAPWRGLRAFVITWLSLHVLFFLWWLPGGFQFAVFVSPGIILLFFIGFSDLGRRASRVQKVALSLCGVLVFSILLPLNLFFSMIPVRHRSPGPAFEAAKGYLEIVPRECLVFAPYRLKNVLLYYHGLDRQQFLNLNREMLFFLNNDSMTPRDPLPVETCMVIPHRELHPARSRSGETGFSNPEGWWEFVRWAFRIRRDEQTQELIHGEISALVDSKGRPYFHQIPRETASRGIGDFARTLDAALREAGKDQAGVYESWYLRSGLTREGKEPREE